MGGLSARELCVVVLALVLDLVVHCCGSLSYCARALSRALAFMVQLLGTKRVHLTEAFFENLYGDKDIWPGNPTWRHTAVRAWRTRFHVTWCMCVYV
jgi:hypothetical protein